MFPSTIRSAARTPMSAPQGDWTIGYGHLCKPDHPPITRDEGEAYLTQDLRSALDATLRYCPVLATESEERLAAIVDFTFNLGAGRLQTSTLRRRVNQRDWPSSQGAATVSVWRRKSSAGVGGKTRGVGRPRHISHFNTRRVRRPACPRHANDG